jgi:hypothetical protein
MYITSVHRETTPDFLTNCFPMQQAIHHLAGNMASWLQVAGVQDAIA